MASMFRAVKYETSEEIEEKFKVKKYQSMFKQKEILGEDMPDEMEFDDAGNSIKQTAPNIPDNKLI